MEQTSQNNFAQTPPPEPPGYTSRNVEQVVTPEVKKTPQNIYGASYSSVIFKNFLAGFFKGLGGVLVYIIFLLIGFVVFNSYIYPEIKPMIDNLDKLTKLAETQTQSPSNSIQITPETLDLIREENSTE